MTFAAVFGFASLSAMLGCIFVVLRQLDLTELAIGLIAIITVGIAIFVTGSMLL